MRVLYRHWPGARPKHASEFTKWPVTPHKGTAPHADARHHKG